MPIFEYICKNCDKHFEALLYGAQKASCPSCKGGNLAQLISVFSVKGKGSGADFAPPAGACGEGACCGGGSCGFDEDA